MKPQATSGASTTHRLYQGDARSFPYITDASVHLVVTSPPYWKLKRYNEDMGGALGRLSREFVEPLIQRVMEILRSVARRDNRTVIVVTHDPRIYKFADRMAEMEDGRILRVLGTPAEIAAAHPVF